MLLEMLFFYSFFSDAKAMEALLSPHLWLTRGIHLDLVV